MYFRLLQLEILKGDTFGLTGNNGAGKTTLFSILLDLIGASSGSVKVDGDYFANQMVI